MVVCDTQTGTQKSRYETLLDSWQTERQYREKQREFGRLADDEAEKRQRIGKEYRHDPDVRAAFSEIGELIGAEHGPETPAVSIEEYFERSSVSAPETKLQVGITSNNRSKWSPKLRALIERLFPEETREERIRLAKERPLTTLEYDVPIEVVKYYAEDVDFECDT